MPAGRPSEYKDEYAHLARKFCLLGATNPQLAEFFDVSVTTIDNWLASKPEFLGAVKEGREYADAHVGESLYQRACGYSHPEEKIFCKDGEVTRVETIKHYPPDPTSLVFWLKNRRRDLWTDRQEVTGADGKALIPEQDATETARRALFALAKALDMEKS